MNGGALQEVSDPIFYQPDIYGSAVSFVSYLVITFLSGSEKSIVAAISFAKSEQEIK